MPAIYFSLLTVVACNFAGFAWLAPRIYHQPGSNCAGKHEIREIDSNSTHDDKASGGTTAGAYTASLPIARPSGPAHQQLPRFCPPACQPRLPRPPSPAAFVPPLTCAGPGPAPAAARSGSRPRREVARPARECAPRRSLRALAGGLPRVGGVWNHFQYSCPIYSEFIRAGRRRFRRLRAGTKSCGPGPPVYDYRGRGTPSHRSGRIHPYVRSCSATGTDRERSDWRT